ncbi:MAG TPA: hypothetical protein VKH44_15005 [Pirellulaceae bacterium]|nr:hypothetical protein [Pirellulaceae bacterium]
MRESGPLVALSFRLSSRGEPAALEAGGSPGDNFSLSLGGVDT